MVSLDATRAVPSTRLAAEPNKWSVVPWRAIPAA